MTSPESTPNPEPSAPLQELLRQEKVGALVMGARRALRRGEKEEARRSLQEALKLDVNDCGALELLGEFYMAEGEQEKAIEVLEKGHQLYPKHAAFEKNIAYCILDLEEMKRDKAAPGMLGAADPDAWMDRKPLIAIILSVVPGAGQVYNGDNVRAAVIFGVWFLSSLAWYFLLMNAMGQLSRNTAHSWANALGQMGGFLSFCFWLFFAASVAAGVYALVDAAAGAAAANARRRRPGGMF